jgi:DNA-binding MarR family transcriptional regulator
MVNRTKKISSSWTFLTNHAHVLLCIADNPNIKMKDLAGLVGITERTVQRIVSDLIDEGYIEIKRDGRCNVYRTHRGMALRHPVESHRTVADLLRLIKCQKKVHAFVKAE